MNTAKNFKRKPAGWKAALMGVVVGAAATVFLGLGTKAAAIPFVAVYAAAIGTMGLLGATLGINRDIFCRIIKRSPAPEACKLVVNQPYITRSSTTHDGTINTIIYEDMPDYPRSDTFPRDQMLASARHTLLSMDHTKSIPH